MTNSHLCRKSGSIVILAILTILFLWTGTAAAKAIDINDKYAFSPAAGWVNFNPANGEVMVYDSHLEGYAWSANAGWVRLGTHTGGGAHVYANDSATSYGVNHDGSGMLSGYAWSPAAGWINFNPSSGGVSIDPSTGQFSGYAWSANLGWIKLAGTAQDTTAYQVKTDTNLYDMQITAGTGSTIGLKTDGTLLTAGASDEDRTIVSGWSNIIQTAAGWDTVFGLRADGTVVAAGMNSDGQTDVTGWTDIIQIAAGRYHTAGLKADGTVVTAGADWDGQADVGEWTDIIQVAAGWYNTMGLKSDGSVVVTAGWNDMSDVTAWTDIIQVVMGDLFAAGLKADGTVVAAGDDYAGQLAVSAWTDIVQVAAGESHTAGLKADGTVMAAGDNTNGQTQVADWMLKTTPDTNIQYTVTFLDHDGSTLKTETVEHGTAATPPPDPARVGYTFTGWDKDISNITEDLEVFATYTEINHAPRAFDSGSPFTVYTFTGLVDTIDDMANAFPADIQVGDTMSGRLIYDVSSPDTGNPGNYELDPQTSGIHISVNDHVFGKVHHTMWLSIQNDTSVWMEDGFQDGDQVNIDASIEEDHEFFWTLTGPVTVVENTELSDNLLDLAWTGIQFELYRIGGNFMQFSINDIEKIPNSPVVVQRDSSVQSSLVAVDTENDPLTYTIVSEPENGTLVLDDPGVGTFTYTPDPGFTGDDSFTFKVNDGLSDSNTATVSITVQPPQEHTVIFKDHDGTVLKEELVEYGNPATAPDDPEREGYTFTGWDPPLPDNIIEDFETTATYEADTDTLSDKFESGDFGALPWQHTGGASWTVQDQTSYDGTYAAMSGDIGDNESSNMKVVVKLPFGGKVSFWYRVSSENNFDFFRFYVNDIEQARWSGDVSWNQVTYDLAPGTHLLRWSYTKDGSVSGGSDTAWVDQIILTGAVLPEIFTVTLHPGEHGTILEANSGNDYVIEIPEGLPFPAANVISEFGYTFTGWDPSPPETITADFETTAMYDLETVIVWGVNDYGPAPVPKGLNNVKDIAVGYKHTVALLEDGTVVAWGEDYSGQATVPEGLTDVAAIAAGVNHTVALLEDGTVVAWGLLTNLAPPDGLANVKAIAAGLTHTVALLEDGTVVTWGWNVSGSLAVPEGLNNVKAIAGGDNLTVALLEDGTVVAWGNAYHNYGQATVPEGLNNVKAVASKYSHTPVLLEDGTVVAWGFNSSGQATVPEGLNNVKAVAAGRYFTIALKENKDPAIHTIRLNAGTQGRINQANTGSDYIVSLMTGETFPNVDVVPDDGWIFIGWDTPLPDTVSDDFEATALYEEDILDPPDPDILTHTDPSASFTGQWTPVTAPDAFQDESMVTQENGAAFTFDTGHTGCRTVSFWWSQDPRRHVAVPVEIYDDITLLDTVYVNQQAGGGQWQELGTYFFDQGAVIVVISDSSTHTTSVDAVQTTATDDCHTVSRVLVPGWNLLTPVHQTAVPITASLWAADMDSQGAQITRVQKWDGTGWQSYSPGAPFGSYDITPGQGYFLFSSQPQASYTQACDGAGPVCGAYVAPDVWKEFDCYNLAAIGKVTGADPFTPSWELIGGYWRWGRKGPDPSEWHNTNTANFAHGPTGPEAADANDGAVTGWDGTAAPDNAWAGADGTKTANDPCRDGNRVPAKSDWDGVLANNTQSTVGTWSNSATNYTSARKFGDALMLPAAGGRYYYESGGLYGRGYEGNYWSSSEYGGDSAWLLTFNSEDTNTDYAHNYGRLDGFSVRCISE